MRNVKLISTLKLLTIKQLKRLLEFSQSPYFNKQTEVTDFLSFLIKQHPHWEEKKLQDEYIFKKMYPKQVFDKDKLYYLRSNTLKLVEKFIFWEEIEKDSFQQDYQLLRFYNQHREQAYFEQSYKNLAQNLVQSPIKDGELAYRQFLLAWQQAEHQFQHTQRTHDLGLNEVHQQLDAFYVLNKLSLFLSTFSLKKVIAIPEVETLEVRDLLAFVENNTALKTHLTIRLLVAHLLLFLYPENEIYFQQATELLFSSKKSLPPTMLSALTTHLRNYYIAAMNQGKSGGIQALFQIYQFQIEEGTIFNEKKEILSANFRNVVVVGLQLKKQEWIKNFISEYADFLPTHQKEDVLAYCWAKYYFEVQEFAEVLKYLNQAEHFPDVFFDLHTRKLLMQTYYELGEIENVVNLLNTFRVYLSRNQKLSEERKAPFLQFASAMNRLIQMDFSDAQKTSAFCTLIAKMERFAEKNWFEEKIAQHSINFEWQL